MSFWDSFNSVYSGMPGAVDTSSPEAAMNPTTDIASATEPLTGAKAKQRAAEEQLQAERDRTAGAVAAAQPSATELQAIQQQQRQYDNMLAQFQAGIDKSREMLNAVQPGLAEAGNQAYQLLKGQNAAILSPMMAQQQRSREQMQAQLRSELGPGYASSSAGQQAMQNFEFNSSQQLQTAQQGALGMLLGSSQQTAGQNALTPQLGMANSSLGALSGSILGAQANIQGRQVAAWNGSQVPSYSGADQLGKIASADYNGGMLKSAMSTGSSMMSSGSGGGGAMALLAA